jgi:hypothetical protein
MIPACPAILCRLPSIFETLTETSQSTEASQATKAFARILPKTREGKPCAPRVTDPYSPYFQMKPAPRVVQNELDAMLEEHVCKLKLQLLSNLQGAMKRKHVPQRDANRVEIFSTVLVLLATLERDMWRLVYCTRHKEEVRRKTSFWYLNLTRIKIQMATPRISTPPSLLCLLHP